MNPKEHSFFYDKRTDQPVVGGEEALSVGNSVFVKNPVYGDPGEFRFQPKKGGEKELFDKSEELGRELESVRSKPLYSGQTFNRDGSVWKPKSSHPVDIVTLASTNLPKEGLTPEAFKEASTKWNDLLAENSNLKVGVFTFDKDGTPTASIDLNVVVPQEFRENTKAFAAANDQVSFWDPMKSEEVPTGGKGDTKISSMTSIARAAAALTKGKPVDVPSLAKLQDVNLPEPIAFSKASKAANDAWAKTYSEEVSKKNPETTPITFTRDAKGKIKTGVDGPAVAPQYYDLESGPNIAGASDKVSALAERLVDFYEGIKNDPKIRRAEKWYSDARVKLQKFFGEDTDLFVQLLASTSPNTGVDVNFGYALDVYNQLKNGKYADVIAKFEEGAKLLEQPPSQPIKSRAGTVEYEGGSELYRLWQQAQFEAGRGAAPPNNVSKTQLLGWWIEKNALQVVGKEGKKIGMHNASVIKTIAGHWLDTVEGPKTLNFYKNLVGKGFEATIDVWAARTLRRLAYEGEGRRWRIPWEAETGVVDKDFAFGQQVFRAAADKLGLSPDALQAVVWFGEKDNYAKRGWTKGSGVEKSDYLQSLEATSRSESGELQLDKRFRKLILENDGDVAAARQALARDLLEQNVTKKPTQTELDL